MAYAAARYTEAKLEPVCDELFRDIDKDTVDFVPQLRRHHDRAYPAACHLPRHSGQHHTLGIAVGMASNICSFNLEELCNATIALMKDPQADLRETIPAPDFPRRRHHPVRRGRDAECTGNRPRQRACPRPVELRQRKQLHRCNAESRPQPPSKRSWTRSLNWSKLGKIK